MYAAAWVEVAHKAPRKDKAGQVIAPVRTEEQLQPDGKRRQLWVYPHVVPGGPFLQALGMPVPWLKLWRDTIWEALRKIPTTRYPYQARADGKDVGEARSLWADLKREQERPDRVAEVAGTLLLGAEARSPDGVPFVGRPAENLLLHFWPVVAGLGKARRVVLEDGRRKEEDVATVLVVPDVLDPAWFADEYRGVVDGLNADVVGYQPRDAICALPEEAGLGYLRDLARLELARAERSRLRATLRGVEVYQLIVGSRQYHMVSSGSVPADRGLIDNFERIQRTRNLILRGQLTRNLLDGRAWYRDFDKVFDRQELGLLTEPNFGREVHIMFTAELEHRRKATQAEEGPPAADLAERIRSMVWSYVEAKVSARAKITWSEIAARPKVKDAQGRDRYNVPPEYRDAREHVCEEAILALRSCRSRESFVAYFCGTLCSVPQYLPEQEYQLITSALLSADERWEDAKALCQLSLSALANV